MGVEGNMFLFVMAPGCTQHREPVYRDFSSNFKGGLIERGNPSELQNEVFRLVCLVSLMSLMCRCVNLGA